MKTKICTNPKCLQSEKPVIEFHKKSASKDGLHCWCKICVKEYNKKYPWKQILRDINHRCTNPKNNRYKDYGLKGIKNKFKNPEEDIKFLWFRDKAYNMSEPTIDRKNNNGDYTLENCQFIENRENCSKDKRKVVLQYSLNGKFIKEFESIIKVERILKINHGHISQCCSGKRKTSGGFKWAYQENIK